MDIKEVTRGGQITLHNIRMFRQVFVVTVLVTVLSGMVFWGAKTWFDFTPYQRYIITSAWWADIKLSISSDKEQESQVFQYENGHEETVLCLALKNNPIIQAWVETFEAQAWHNAYLSCWLMGGLFLLICIFWRWRGNVKKFKEILSGSRIVEPAELQKVLEKQKIASSFKIGPVSLRLNTETQHMLICGTTGAGKSTCFYHLLPQIREKNQRAVIVDTTGEFVSRFYRKGKDILINPFDKRSVGWNPWIDCRLPYHYDELASAFIPQTGHDIFWSASARTVFSETLRLLAHQDMKNMDILLNFLLEVSLNQLYEVLKNTPAASLMDPAGDRTAMSIRSHLSPYLKNLRYFSPRKRAFSVRDWVLKDAKAKVARNAKGTNGQWLFIASTPDQRETLKPLMTGLMTCAINSLLSTPPDSTRRLWFIIDEFASLHKQEAFPKALAEIRKYGGCIAIGLQDVSQLQGLYGHTEARSLTSLFNTKVIFRNTDPETAKHMSQMLGEQEVRETIEGISYGAHQTRDGVSLNEQKHFKPIVTPNDVMNLNDLGAYLKLPGDLPVTKIKFESDQTKKLCRAFVPNTDNSTENRPPESKVIKKSSRRKAKSNGKT